MKLIAAILFLASASAGLWAVHETANLMHQASQSFQSSLDLARAKQ